MTNVNRREWLQQAAGAGLSIGAALASAETASGYFANDTLNIGCIGTGGRCRALMKPLATIPNVRIGAVCDIWDVHLNQGKELADPKASMAKEWRRILDDPSIDAVLIATPDHWHSPMAIAACEAGKDVYVEKPLTHNLEEGQGVIDAQNKSKKIVQIGTQQRSMPQFQKALELIKAGRIGRIVKVHLTWNRNADRVQKRPLGVDPASVDWKAFLGNAPSQPFDEYRFRNWRWFWDFGNGILTDLMVHYIDVVHWFLNVDHPEKAVTIGSHLSSEGVWETPDTIQTLLHYPDGVQVYFEGTFSNARNGAMLEFMGTDATLYLDRGRYEVHPERGRGEYEEFVLGSGKRGADFYDKPDGELLHLANWVECVRSRETPNAPAEAGVSAASAAHLGNQAYRTGETANWKKNS